MLKKISIILMVLSVGFFIIDCGKLGKFLPNKALKGYYEAQKNKEWGTMYDYLSEEMKGQLSLVMNSPMFAGKIKAMAKGKKLETDKDKFIVLGEEFGKFEGMLKDYSIVSIPKVEKGQAEINAKVTETRDKGGKEIKKNLSVTLKLEKDGWKIKEYKKIK